MPTVTPEELDALMDGLTWEAYEAVLASVSARHYTLDGQTEAMRLGLVGHQGALTSQGRAVVARLREIVEGFTDEEAKLLAFANNTNADLWLKPIGRAVAEVARG